MERAIEAGKERTRFGTRRKRKQYVCEITYPLRAMVLTQLSRLLEKNRHHRSRDFLCPTSSDRAANEPFFLPFLPFTEEPLSRMQKEKNNKILVNFPLGVSLSLTRRRLTGLQRIASRRSRTTAVVKEVFTPESRPLSRGFSTHPDDSPATCVRYMTKSIVSSHLSPPPPSLYLHPFFPLPHLPQKLGLDFLFPFFPSFFCGLFNFSSLIRILITVDGAVSSTFTFTFTFYLGLLSLQKAAYLFIVIILIHSLIHLRLERLECLEHFGKPSMFCIMYLTYLQ